MFRQPILRPIALALLLPWLSACSEIAWRARFSSTMPVEADTPYLKVHTADGRVFVFSTWRMDGDHVTGSGLMYGAERGEPQAGDFTVPQQEVALVDAEVPEVVQHPNRGWIIAAILGGAAALAALIVVAVHSLGPSHISEPGVSS